MKRSQRVRERHRRGRRVFLWGLAVVVLAQVVTGYLLDYRLPDVRFPQAGTMFERWTDLPAAPQIVCFGSSRFEGGIDANVIDADLARCFVPAPRSFNSALPGGDPIVADWFLERVFADGHRPNLLVLEISPETINHRGGWLEWQALRIFTWSDCATNAFPIIRYCNVTRVLASRILPLYHHRYEIRKQARNALLASEHPPAQDKAPQTASASSAGASIKSMKTPAEAGLAAPTPPNIPLTVSLEDTGDLHRWIRDFRPGGPQTAALERLLERCRADGVAVVLVGVPVSTKHRVFYTPSVVTAYREYILNVTQDYGCKFVDLSERVPDCCFGDHHHISQQGREFVSRLLAWEVVLPAWRELHQRPANKSY